MECVVLDLQVERFRPVVETCRNLCCNSLLNIAISLVREVRRNDSGGRLIGTKDVLQ